MSEEKSTREILQRMKKDAALMAEGKAVLEAFATDADSEATEEAAMRFLVNAAEDEETVLQYGHPLHIAHELGMSLMAMALGHLMEKTDIDLDSFLAERGVDPASIDNGRKVGDAIYDALQNDPNSLGASPGVGFLMHMYDIGRKIHDLSCVPIRVLEEVRDLWVQTSDSPAAEAVRENQATVEEIRQKILRKQEEQNPRFDPNLN